MQEKTVQDQNCKNQLYLGTKNVIYYCMHISGGEYVTEDDVLEAVDRARTQVYDDVPKTKGPTMRDFMQGGSLGFGYSN